MAAEVVEFTLSKSYLWQCLTLSEDCPFFSCLDPNLPYFGLGILTAYLGLMFIFGWDLWFTWTVDKLQLQMDYYLNAVRQKVRRVQMDQHRLVSTKERTEKQLKRSQVGNHGQYECTMLVSALRGAVHSDDPAQILKITTSMAEDSRISTPDDSTGFWNVDF